MGLIAAAWNAAGGTLASQWKEYFYVDSLPDNVLATKAEKKVKARFGGSRREDDNVISDGSVVAVADGQCMMIVDQGKIVDFCAEPGEYVFEQGGEPSIFYGPFNGEKMKAVLKTTFDRLSFGGQAGRDQRVYFFNTKEILGNKYGTPSPVPFRVVDGNIGLDVDISIRCFGEYSYRVTNPMLFYTHVCGNVEGDYTREQIDSQLKSELLTALQPAFAKISEKGVRYSALPGHTTEIAAALNDVLSEKWANLRGVEIVSFGINSVKASEEDEAMIKELQKKFNFTIIFVTHDQSEAMALSDRMMVMDMGNIVQIGTPTELYNRPANRFVHKFLGQSTFTDVVIQDGKVYAKGDMEQPLPVALPENGEREMVMATRPNQIAINHTDGYKTKIEKRIFLTNYTEYLVRVGDQLLQVQTPHRNAFAQGETCYLKFPGIMWYGREDEQAEAERNRRQLV